MYYISFDKPTRLKVIHTESYHLVLSYYYTKGTPTYHVHRGRPSAKITLSLQIKKQCLCLNFHAFINNLIVNNKYLPMNLPFYSTSHSNQNSFCLVKKLQINFILKTRK